MKSAVTVSLVKEAKGGPFVFWDDLPALAARWRAERAYEPRISVDERSSLHHDWLRAVERSRGWATSS